MFFPRQLLELEALLPAPMPASLRRFLARRPQGGSFGGLFFYPRAWVLERYKVLLEEDPGTTALPVARDAAGNEILVDVVTEVVTKRTGQEQGVLQEKFEDWIRQVRQEKKVLASRKMVHAARAGNIARMQRLRNKGVSINEQDADGNTPLMAALLAWQYDAAYYLIECGADIHLRDRAGHTALMWACYRNQPGLVKLLMEKGADLHAETASGEGLMLFVEEAPNAHAENTKTIVELLRSAGLQENRDAVD